MFLTVPGIILLFNGVFVAFVESFNWGVATCIILGLFLILCGVFYKKINLCKTLRVVHRFLCICLCVFALFVGVVQTVGIHDTVTYEEDALIVLGAGLKGDKITPALKSRLDKALEYIEKNPDVTVVVSGGKGSQETVTEAEAMYHYLVAHGVPGNQIIKEDRATSTAENMTYSKELLDSKFHNPYELLTDMAFPGQPYLVAFVTNDFHICRGAMLAQKRGFQGATHIHAGLQWYNYAPCYIREAMAMVKSVLFD